MMQLMVDDLDAWWAHIDALDLPSKFGPSTEATGGAAMGPSHRICIRSVGVLACGATTQRDHPGRMKPAALSLTEVEQAEQTAACDRVENAAREQSRVQDR